MWLLGGVRRNIKHLLKSLGADAKGKISRHGNMSEDDMLHLVSHFHHLHFPLSLLPDVPPNCVQRDGGSFQINASVLSMLHCSAAIGPHSPWLPWFSLFPLLSSHWSSLTRTPMVLRVSFADFFCPICLSCWCLSSFLHTIFFVFFPSSLWLS